LKQIVDIEKRHGCGACFVITFNVAQAILYCQVEGRVTMPTERL